MSKIQYKEVKFQNKSLELIERVNSIIAEYHQQGYELTLRQVYYQLVARGFIPNNERSYKNLGNLINEGRLAGLIDWYAMVCMSRNKSRFFYALYVSKEQGTDEWGNPTGGVDITYGDPQEYRANVSAAKGETQTRQFGESENYDKVIVMGGDAPPIDEYSILWIDCIPRLDENGALALNDEGEVITPHDYIVKKVARNFCEMYEAYHKLGGNGMITKMKEEIEELHLGKAGARKEN